MNIEEHQDDLRLLEALLFASPEPLTLKILLERVGEHKADILTDLLKELKNNYEGRGVNLVQRDGAWAFRTAEDLEGALSLEREVERKLSRAALETLTIVGYHQPVTRAEIESIRGVSTNRGTLDVLIEAGWVKPGRRRQVPGRPLTWVTTPHFLDHFGLESLKDLPGVEELKAAGLLDKRPAMETMATTSDMFEDEDGSREEEGDDVEVDIIEPSEVETEETDDEQQTAVGE